MRFKKWLMERTLYHGTVVDNEDSMRQYGLQGGWNGLGGFVSAHYGDEDYGEPTEDDQVIFLADKRDLSKALNAMVFHIGQKVGKGFHDVTDADIRNHGLLVVVDDPDNSTPQAQDDIGYADYPRGVEPYDYYAKSATPTKFVKGAALLRLMSRYGNWPRTWGPDDANRDKAIRGELAKRAIRKHTDKTPDYVVSRAKSMSKADAGAMLNQYRRDRHEG